MDCGTSLVKKILFTFNSLLTVMGILGIVYGVLILQATKLIEYKDLVRFPPQALLPIVLISVGSIVIFISFLGSFGAICESFFLTISYAVILEILLNLQVTLIVLLFINMEKFDTAMGDAIDMAWNSDRGRGNVFAAIENSFQCCGAISYKDYTDEGLDLPKRCFIGVKGCRDSFVKFISVRTDYAVYGTIGLIGIEMITLIFSICLAKNVRNAQIHKLGETFTHLFSFDTNRHHTKNTNINQNRCTII